MISAPLTHTPPHQLHTPEGIMTVERAWPGSGSRQADLAVELRKETQLRAGWWSSGDLSLLPAGDDPRLPALQQTLRAGPPGGGETPGQVSEATVVSHRPGKRAVVRISTPGAQTAFVKIVRQGRAAGVLSGMQRAAPFAEHFRTPELLAHTDSTVRLSEIQGRSLHQATAFTDHEWRTAWTQILHCWTESTAQPAQGATAALIHRAASEVQVLRHWHQATVGHLTDPEESAEAVERVSDLLSRLPGERLRPAHRDLHDKQLLWSAHQGPGLLDVDTACAADPALDLGNLRAHATLRSRQGVWSPDHAETVRFCVDHAAELSETTRHAVAVYEQAALLRLGFIYAVRPQYAHMAAELRAAQAG